MNRSLSAFLLFVALGPLCGRAQDVKPVCDIEEQPNQMNRNLCAAQLFDQADKILNELYRKLINYNKDGPPLTDADPLRAAQRAWVDYRDKSCAYEAPLSPPGVQGGSSESEEHFRCLADYTNERVHRLQHYVWCQAGNQNGPC